MKKKFLLLLPVIVLMGMAIMVKPVNFTVARAEDGVSEAASEEAPSEEVFEPKTYVYEEDGNKATLVLLSATEFSVTINEETKYGTYVRVGNNVSLKLGEETLEISVNDILGTFGEPVEEQKKTSILETLENFVVPMVSALVGVIGFNGLVTIVFGIIRLVINKKANDDRKADVDTIKTDTGNAASSSANAEQKIIEASENIGEISKDVIKNNAEMQKDNKDIKKNTDVIPFLIKGMVAMSKLLALYMSNDKDSVANGFAEKANQITNDLENITE